jgi:methionine-rich copper-binding protein CopC
MMKKLRISFVSTALAAALYAPAALFGPAAFFAPAAWAHAMLDHAVPAVGGTVQGAPGELQIAFTQNIVASFSGAELKTAEGAAIPTGKAAVDPANPKVMRVPVGQKLKPGLYVVTWHVVSVDSQRSSGSYKFTVAP